MAVPPHFTTLDLSGEFILNNALSDSADDLLARQGVSNPDLRRSIMHGVLSFNHYTDDDGSERIWVAQEIERQGLLVDEERMLDWQERSRDDPAFGPIISKIRRITTHGLEPRFLRAGWTPDTLKYGVLHYHVRKDTALGGRPWTTSETWGIESIDGKRYFARHVELTIDGIDSETHLVYDYVGAII
ncbi:hypothetical protein DFH07DRAFT_964124 [Mycena maculata]|uniref:Uncharacterized protein n=1 Tax=Mycena maculata TaxID=230809 RepID=A0AAD7IHV7_9AGAR|nr:hypothetical protein DFH07DRAFT_964124 [Mycena maculata]